VVVSLVVCLYAMVSTYWGVLDDPSGRELAVRTELRLRAALLRLEGWGEPDKPAGAGSVQPPQHGTVTNEFLQAQDSEPPAPGRKWWGTPSEALTRWGAAVLRVPVTWLLTEPLLRREGSVHRLLLLYSRVAGPKATHIPFLSGVASVRLSGAEEVLGPATGGVRKALGAPPRMEPCFASPLPEQMRAAGTTLEQAFRSLREVLPGLRRGEDDAILVPAMETCATVRCASVLAVWEALFQGFPPLDDNEAAMVGHMLDTAETCFDQSLPGQPPNLANVQLARTSLHQRLLAHFPPAPSIDSDILATLAVDLYFELLWQTTTVVSSALGRAGRSANAAHAWFANPQRYIVESLRVSPPVKILSRNVEQPTMVDFGVELDGPLIVPAGTMHSWLLSSANTDSTAFGGEAQSLVRAERFDSKRTWGELANVASWSSIDVIESCNLFSLRLTSCPQGSLAQIIVQRVMDHFLELQAQSRVLPPADDRADEASVPATALSDPRTRQRLERFPREQFFIEGVDDIGVSSNQTFSRFVIQPGSSISASNMVSRREAEALQRALGIEVSDSPETYDDSDGGALSTSRSFADLAFVTWAIVCVVFALSLSFRKGGVGIATRHFTTYLTMQPLVSFGFVSGMDVVSHVGMVIGGLTYVFIFLDFDSASGVAPWMTESTEYFEGHTSGLRARSGSSPSLLPPSKASGSPSKLAMRRRGSGTPVQLRRTSGIFDNLPSPSVLLRRESGKFPDSGPGSPAAASRRSTSASRRRSGSVVSEMVSPGGSFRETFRDSFREIIPEGPTILPPPPPELDIDGVYEVDSDGLSTSDEMPATPRFTRVPPFVAESDAASSENEDEGVAGVDEQVFQRTMSSRVLALVSEAMGGWTPHWSVIFTVSLAEYSCLVLWLIASYLWALLWGCFTGRLLWGSMLGRVLCFTADRVGIPRTTAARVVVAVVAVWVCFFIGVVHWVVATPAADAITARVVVAFYAPCCACGMIAVTQYFLEGVFETWGSTWGSVLAATHAIMWGTVLSMASTLESTVAYALLCRLPTDRERLERLHLWEFDAGMVDLDFLGFAEEEKRGVLDEEAQEEEIDLDNPTGTLSKARFKQLAKEAIRKAQSSHVARCVKPATVKDLVDLAARFFGVVGGFFAILDVVWPLLPFGGSHFYLLSRLSDCVLFVPVVIPALLAMDTSLGERRLRCRQEFSQYVKDVRRLASPRPALLQSPTGTFAPVVPPTLFPATVIESSTTSASPATSETAIEQDPSNHSLSNSRIVVDHRVQNEIALAQHSGRRCTMILLFLACAMFLVVPAMISAAADIGLCTFVRHRLTPEQLARCDDPVLRRGIDPQTRILVGLLGMELIKFSEAPSPEVIRIPTEKAMLRSEDVFGIRVPVQDIDDHTGRTWQEWVQHHVQNVVHLVVASLVQSDALFPVIDNPDTFDSPSHGRDTLQLLQTLGMPEATLRSGALGEALDSDIVTERWMLCGLASHSLEAYNISHSQGKHELLESLDVAFVSDYNWMYALDVRPGFSRYGATAFLNSSGNLIAIWSSPTSTMVLRPSEAEQQEFPMPEHVHAWRAAKFLWRSCALVYVTLGEHLIGVHLFAASSLVQATRATLDPGHLLRRFLTIHTYKTVDINKQALRTLTVKYGLVHRASALTWETVARAFDSIVRGYEPAEVLSKMLRQQTLAPAEEDDSESRRALQARGPSFASVWNASGSPESGHAVRVLPALADFPFAEDLLEFRNIVFEYVYSFICLTYQSDADVLHDKQLQSFHRILSEQRERHAGGPFDVPRFSSRMAVAQVLTDYIVTVTGIHTSVGHVSDYLLDPTSASGKVRPGAIMSDVQGVFQVAVIAMATGFPQPALSADFSHMFEDLPNSRSAIRIAGEFRTKLLELGRRIDERNEARRIPCNAFHPRFLQSSVSI
jgi:type IV secretory pathway TrbD component